MKILKIGNLLQDFWQCVGYGGGRKLVDSSLESTLESGY